MNVLYAILILSFSCCFNAFAIDASRPMKRGYPSLGLGGPLVPGPGLSISYYRPFSKNLAIEIGAGSALIISEVFATLTYVPSSYADGYFVGAGTNVGVVGGFGMTSDYFGLSTVWGYQWEELFRQTINVHAGWNFSYFDHWFNGDGRQSKSTFRPSHPTVGLKYVIGFEIESLVWDWIDN